MFALDQVPYKTEATPAPSVRIGHQPEEGMVLIGPKESNLGAAWDCICRKSPAWGLIGEERSESPPLLQGPCTHYFTAEDLGCFKVLVLNRLKGSDWTGNIRLHQTDNRYQGCQLDTNPNG